MPEHKSNKILYRTRTVRSIIQTMQPIVSKSLIDFQTDESETTPGRRTKVSRQVCSFRFRDVALDRIINKLKTGYKAEDILLMITPASAHVNRYKLHVIQRHKQGHLCTITITSRELSRLKASTTLHKYSIVFGSRYVDLKNVMKAETIKSLVNKECCEESKKISPVSLLNPSNSITSSAGDYLKEETVKSIIFHDSFIQTEPELADNIIYTLNDIYALIENINQNLEYSKEDIERFFSMAEQLNFSLIVRPMLLWRTFNVVANNPENIRHFLMESYLPDNCYLGFITLLEHDLMQALDFYPKLLFNIHVIEDVYELTPLPKNFISAARKFFSFFKLELLYDAIGEMLFDWYKNFTFL